jgi:hypothetical protein
MLEHVDYLEVVPAVELLLADPVEIVDRNLRSGTRAGYIEGQYVLGQDFLRFVEGLGANSANSASKLCHRGPPVAIMDHETTPPPGF